MMRWLLLVSLALMALIGGLYYDFVQWETRSRSVPASLDRFVIEPGSSAQRVARDLVDTGLIDRPLWLDLYLRLDDRGRELRGGEYALPEAASVRELIDLFRDGDTIQYSATIIEGTTFRELRVRLSTIDALEQTIGELDDAALMAAIGAEGLHPEGQFLADTYRFPRGTRDIDFLRRAHRSLNRTLEQAWRERADDAGELASPYEALILASIIEKETAVASERTLISGVFHARLALGMRLQTDPTVIYGLGPSFDGDIRRRDLVTDTPYNTYTRGGLPPTPIALVGREAIHASLHPEASDALYFVSRGDGTHHFSATLDEHNRAVQRFQLGR